MPHLRTRHILTHIKKLASLWPALGVVGPRQSGKTTLLSQLLGIESVVSLDDSLLREEALHSPDIFLSRLNLPTVIDEIQKAPPLFDALKLSIDKKRIPGRYYLTGSSSFSTRIGIRESLTGRLGLTTLTPLVLAELHSKTFLPIKDIAKPDLTQSKPRFSVALVAKALDTGGMPVPAFLRSANQRNLYWQSWLETTLYRDLARLFQRQYDPDLALNLLNRMASVMKDGECPTLKHFHQPARKVRNYLSAMEDIFLVRRVSCHPLGMGKEFWSFFDTGLLHYLLSSQTSEGLTTSLVRHFLWNEWFNQAQWQGLPFEKLYYKSAHGSVIDAVFNNVPFRIVGTSSELENQQAWLERPLIGAMKKLKAKFGYLVAPTDRVVLPPKTGGIGVLPWSMWS